MNGNAATRRAVLCWPGRLLSADDLRRHLTSQRELVLLPRTIVTPLAADELRAKRRAHHAGNRRRRTSDRGQRAGMWATRRRPPTRWSTSARRRHWNAMGVTLAATLATNGDPARAIAASGRRRDCRGGVVFCDDPGLVCCVANKVAGLRAVAVSNVAADRRVQSNLGAEPARRRDAGPDVFRGSADAADDRRAATRRCPDGLANVLQELDGHAHR